MDVSKSLTSLLDFPSTNKRRWYILVVDIVLLFLLLEFLPFDEKANAGIAVLIFVGVLWLTEAIHVTITALCIPILAVFLDLLNTGEALRQFSNPIIFLFLGGFALATALHIQGIDRLIANRLLMIAHGKLSVVVLLIFGVTAFLSMWISNTATTAMILPLVLGILANLDLQTERNTFVFVLLGVAYSASIGGLGTIVGSPPNAIAASALGLDFLSWMKYGIPMMLVLLPLMLFSLYIVFRPNLKHQFELKLEHLEWNGKRLTVLFIFFISVVCWISSSFISSALGYIKELDSIIAISAAVLIVVTGVASWEQIQNNTQWGVLILFGGGLTLSTILSSSGASAIMANTMAEYFTHSSWFVIILVVTTFIVLLTEFTSNTASAALLIPIFGIVGEALGMPNFIMTMIIGIGASCAFMLPVATAPNAIVFGTGYIKQTEMVRVGILLNILCIMAISLIAWFFWL